MSWFSGITGRLYPPAIAGNERTLESERAKFAEFLTTRASATEYADDLRWYLDTMQNSSFTALQAYCGYYLAPAIRSGSLRSFVQEQFPFITKNDEIAIVEDHLRFFHSVLW
jgi:hypothetical protein